MKILICGSGSIGQRHIRNLIFLGIEDIILYRTKKNTLPSFGIDIPIYYDLQEALNKEPNIAFITNPTSLHIETSIQCARSKCHLFIEKPISHNLDNIQNLESLCKQNNLVCMVGFMMRYHPLIKKIREYIKSENLGKIIHFRSFWGEDVSTWHPWEDYRKSYSTNQKMGGGPELTLSHDIDLALWLIKSGVSIVTKSKINNSSLDLNCNHGVDFNIVFDNKITANIHLDYYTNPPKRDYDIFFEQGRIHLDYYLNEMNIHSQNECEKITAEDFVRNNLFVEEIKVFLDAVSSKKPSPIDLGEGLKSLKLALTQ